MASAATADGETEDYLPASLRGVTLTNENEPIYVVVDNATEIDKVLREYEIANTVKFVTQTSSRQYNKDYLPWEGTEDDAKSVLIRFSTAIVPTASRPVITVAKRYMSCKFGGSGPRGEPKRSMKIGCQSRVRVEECLRIISPFLLRDNMKTDNGPSDYARRQLRAAIKKAIDDKSVKWKREFHVVITPLCDHLHAVGEAAGPNMPVDSEIKERIRDLANTGIISTDVVRENIAHYVKNVMFKGRQCPPKTNRRFNPTAHDIANVLSVMKIGSAEKHSGQVEKKIPQSLFTQRMPALESAATSIEESSDEDDISELLKAAQYIEQGTFQHLHERPMPANEMIFDNQVIVETTVPDRGRKSGKLNASARTEYTTRGFCGMKNRNPLQKVTLLLRKLAKLASILEKDEDLSTLSTLLVDVMLKAKPMIPKDKLCFLYQNEPRKLLHARRVRPKRAQKTKVIKPRAPPLKENHEQKEVIEVETREVKEENELKKGCKSRKRKHWTEIYGSYSNRVGVCKKVAKAEPSGTPSSSKCEVTQKSNVSENGQMRDKSNHNESVNGASLASASPQLLQTTLAATVNPQNTAGAPTSSTTPRIVGKPTHLVKLAVKPVSMKSSERAKATSSSPTTTQAFTLRSADPRAVVVLSQSNCSVTQETIASLLSSAKRQSHTSDSDKANTLHPKSIVMIRQPDGTFKLAPPKHLSDSSPQTN